MDCIFGDAIALVPSDSATQSFDALFVGGAGNVTVVTAQGRTVTFTGVTAGTRLPIRGRKVMATGTTSTNIVGFVS